ncbi:MAG: glycosyltransferase family 2 protein [Polaromonas sp.]|nr:glycosyltransferase family 2 protein [Polaromonas sp.]
MSVIVITQNEEHHIEACLRSAHFADQLVVLDSGSTDATRELALALGAEVSENADWQGFGTQKNRALALANREWVLCLDADERLTPALQKEIAAAIKAPAFQAYSFPRLSSYCGQYMRHSGWYPDRVTRLFRRGAAQFSSDLVHEKLLTHEAVGQLKGVLLHDSFASLESVLDKVNRYSTAGAKQRFDKGQSASLAGAVLHGLWAFIRTYVLRRGFLDGRMGLVLAISNAEGTYYRYLKLWLLCRQHLAAREADNTSDARVPR